MTETFKDYLPANARINIVYEPFRKAEFTYPIKYTYKEAIWKCAYSNAIQFWLSIHYWPLMYGAILWIIGYSTWLYFNPSIEVTTTILDWTTPLKGTIIVFIMMAYAFIPPAIITLYISRNKERLSHYAPLLAVWSAKLIGGSLKKTFTPTDIVDNKAIIPLFKNVFLNYNATGEMSEYLESVEIFEYQFNIKRPRLYAPWMKTEKNEYYWRAVFHFKQTPKNGSLETDFH